MIIALAIFAAIAVGSSMQRVSGMGVGLISGPILSLILGPVEGIMVLNILACINAGATTVVVRKNVVWSQVALLGSVLVLGSVPAAFLIAAMDTAPLLMLVGVSLSIALGVVILGTRYVPPDKGHWTGHVVGVTAWCAYDG